MCSSAVTKASAERSLELGDLQLNRRPNHAAVIHDSARSRVRLRHVLGRSCNARRYTSNAWRNVGPFIVRFAAVIRVMSMAMGERGDGINPRGNHGPCDKTNRRAGLCILAGRAATSSFALGVFFMCVYYCLLHPNGPMLSPQAPGFIFPCSQLPSGIANVKTEVEVKGITYPPF